MKLMFNQSFETRGRTVFKIGGGFEILPSILVPSKYFKSTSSTLKYFKGTSSFEIF